MKILVNIIIASFIICATQEQTFKIDGMTSTGIGFTTPIN